MRAFTAAWGEVSADPVANPGRILRWNCAPPCVRTPDPRDRVPRSGTGGDPCRRRAIIQLTHTA